MLHPSTSSIVAINAPATSVASRGDAAAIVARLFDFAEIATIPTCLAEYPAPVSAGLIDNSLFRSRPKSYPFEPATAAWAATSLGKAIAETGRSQLVICGYWLEDAVTLLAAHAMRAGLDTYVAIDGCGCLDSSSRGTLQARLTQFNAVVTTTRQIAREWAALSLDRQSADALIAESNAL